MTDREVNQCLKELRKSRFVFAFSLTDEQRSLPKDQQRSIPRKAFEHLSCYCQDSPTMKFLEIKKAR